MTLQVNQILTLRDMALEYLPKLRELRERNARFGAFYAEQTLDTGWRTAWLDPLATGVQRQAAELLAKISIHPDTAIIGHWGWNSHADPETIAKNQQTLALMREQQAEIEGYILDEARKLCELTGRALPPWMSSEAPVIYRDTGKVSTTVSTVRWTKENLLSLLAERQELDQSRHPSPTKTLARKHNISDSLLRKLLVKARELSSKTPGDTPPATPPATWCSPLRSK